MREGGGCAVVVATPGRLRDFMNDGDVKLDRVTTLVWSEFGRRVKENGSRGTDHGTAGPMFVVGGGVRPGLHGEQPAVGSLDSNGDLKFTTDFRSVYASVIAQRFNVEPKDVLGAAYPTLPLYA